MLTEVLPRPACTILSTLRPSRRTSFRGRLESILRVKEALKACQLHSRLT